MFLGIHKSYEKLDCGCLLQTFKGYSVVPKMRGVLEEFWENQKVITRQNGYSGTQFRATCVTTQEGLA